MQIPTECAGIEPEVLDPINTWESKDEYKKTIKKLAMGYTKNFQRYAKDTGEEVIKAGPKI